MASTLPSLFLGVILWSIPQSDAACYSTGNNKSTTSECWYTLWYFWFVLVLFIVGVTILLMFYCKIRAKNQVIGMRGSRRPGAMVMPLSAPAYNVPSYPPPSYEMAMVNHPLPPGYVEGTPASNTRNNNGTRFPSTLSIGALSNPPPYSPPRDAVRMPPVR